MLGLLFMILPFLLRVGGSYPDLTSNALVMIIGTKLVIEEEDCVVIIWLGEDYH